jgi:hypothetical protein
MMKAFLTIAMMVKAMNTLLPQAALHLNARFLLERWSMATSVVNLPLSCYV